MTERNDSRYRYFSYHLQFISFTNALGQFLSAWKNFPSDIYNIHVQGEGGFTQKSTK
jgi:hypothetical protein